MGASDLGAFESQGFTLAITEGSNQLIGTDHAFATPLTVSITPNNAGEPTAGGVVNFAGPSSGASINPAHATALISNEQASLSVTANGTSGTYQVDASTLPSNTVSFNLTNVGAPIAQTGTATTITNNSATLNGSVNPGGFITTVNFNYGLTAALGSTITAAQSPLDGTTSTPGFPPA